MVLDVSQAHDDRQIAAAGMVMSDLSVTTGGTIAGIGRFTGANRVYNMDGFDAARAAVSVAEHESVRGSERAECEEGEKQTTDMSDTAAHSKAPIRYCLWSESQSAAYGIY